MDSLMGPGFCSTNTERKAAGRPFFVALAMMLLVAGLAGCIQADPSDEPASREGQSRTLSSPPDLQIGEWWTIEIFDPATDTLYDGTFVVTDRSEQRATIGMPTHEFQHIFFIFHLPPLGDLQLDTFAWNVMGHDFKALEFPAQEGHEWTTVFHAVDYGWEVQAEVTKVEDGKAHVHMVGDNVLIDLVYDAQTGMIIDFQESAFGLSFKVTDHGFGYEGSVQTPTGIDLGFVDGRIAGAVDPFMQPAPPVFTIDVAQDRTHGTLALMVFDVFQDVIGEGTPGVYRAAVTAPDGTPFERTFTIMPGGPGLVAELYGHDSVKGTWEIEFETAGPGAVMAELIVYDLIEAELGGP